MGTFLWDQYSFLMLIQFQGDMPSLLFYWVYSSTCSPRPMLVWPMANLNDSEQLGVYVTFSCMLKNSDLVSLQFIHSGGGGDVILNIMNLSKSRQLLYYEM